MMQSAEPIPLSKGDADLYISMCEEGDSPLLALCAPHHILPHARVVHVTGTELGGVSGPVAPINAPFPVHFDAVVCLHQNASHILQANQCVHGTCLLISIFAKVELLIQRGQPAYQNVQGAANMVHDMQPTTPEG